MIVVLMLFFLLPLMISLYWMQGNGRIPLIDAKRPVNVLLIRSLNKLINPVCLRMSVLRVCRGLHTSGSDYTFVDMPDIRGSEKQRTQNS